MDAFRELTPEEIKLTTIQFLGQHLTGELKELDRNIVSKNQTLQGNIIDPMRILRTIPSDQRPAVMSQPESQPVATVVNAGINIQHQQAPVQPPVITQTDTQVFVMLKRIEEKLDTLLNKS